jgi:hypothetical protein
MKNVIKYAQGIKSITNDLKFYFKHSFELNLLYPIFYLYFIKKKS